MSAQAPRAETPRAALPPGGNAEPPSPLPPLLRYHQHVIGHHCYTNVAHKDPDLAHAPQLMREHASVKWRPAHATQEHWTRVLLIWSVAVGAGLQILSDVRANVRGTYNNAVAFKTMERARFHAHTLGRALYVCSLFVWPWFCLPPLKALVWTIFPIVLFSWHFMLNSQINHLTAETAHASDPSFFRHQIVTAQDFGTQSWWCYVVSGGLNMQARESKPSTPPPPPPTMPLLPLFSPCLLRRTS